MRSGPWQRARALLARSPTAVNVGTLMSGTVLSQVIMLLTQAVVSRYFGPQEYGSFAAFMAIPQTVAVIAGLRYDMAVVLPKRDADARKLVRAVLVIATIASIVTSALTWAAAPTIASWMNRPELAPWLGWSGVIVWATATVNLMGYWFTRTINYSAISANRLQQSATVEGARILAGATGHAGGIGGQMFGQVLGQVLAALTMLWRGRDAWRQDPSTVASGRKQATTRRTEDEEAPAASTRALLRRYRRMPLFNAPNALVDAVRTNGIVLLIGLDYTVAVQGQFGKAWLLMQAPLALINGAVSQVFFQRFATTPRGQMRALVDKSVRMSLLAGLIPFALLGVISPWLFPWYLGDQWELAGQIARALVPWLYLNLATSPISTVFVVADRQGAMLTFACAYAAAPLAAIALLGAHGTGIVTLVWIVSTMMAVLLAGLVLLTRRVATQWDAAVPPTAGRDTPA
ncbi:MAG: oligosaccharide flippase family protein [Actinomyces sp.]|nr:oligosaccharide flippase family protein [Actinomyces sp.]MCI1663211.1 oligosaccharide flippase family protein [Actinomyces sp.]